MTRILLVLALAACGGGTRQGHPPTTVPTSPTTTTETPPVEGVAKPLTAAECQQLAKHIVQVSLKERPDDQQLSAAEQDNLDLKPTVEMCQSMRRDTFECAMSASATAQMAACDQRTPSSSTSNSSVAPGGMTPPAPR